MGKKNTGSTTDDTENTDKCYLTFTNTLMHELHGVKSIVDATSALLREHKGLYTDSELLSASFLLKMITDKVEGVVTLLDDSSFSYIQKEEAVA